MSDALEVFFAADADRAVRVLWDRLDAAGVPSLNAVSHRAHRPHVTFAFGSAIPGSAREALRAELHSIHLPRLWLRHLGVFTGKSHVLLLGVTVDVELLALHSAVHDVLAGRVRTPATTCLPGSWTPHCTLAKGLTTEKLAIGLSALVPFTPIEATVVEVGVVDTATGTVDRLWAN
jgi:2'-5' RNA ligase